MRERQADASGLAARLRHAQTPEEGMLWGRLLGGRLLGLKWRRQHPFGPYVLDFFCDARNLAVEIDGSGHLEDEARDEARSRWLAEQDVRVLRFWNHDVRLRMDAVLDAILEVANERHSPPGRGCG
jgi:very-short-patch-repair endonuclease